MRSLDPLTMIEQYAKELSPLSDDELLRALRALAPLPPESHKDWNEESTWLAAYRFLAFSDLCATRRIRASVPLLLDRASSGDPGEMMRGLRHTLEGIFDPDRSGLAAVLCESTKSASPGARRWALNELGTLRDSVASAAVMSRLVDEIEVVREEACFALRLICKAHPKLLGDARVACREAAARLPKDQYLAKLLSELGA